ncbi:MAG: hypothetical protein JXR40_08065 [Pontiellaceae bacterium]|nr:hypothetical protein [Pontiellaceae bacterium]
MIFEDDGLNKGLISFLRVFLILIWPTLLWVVIRRRKSSGEKHSQDRYIFKISPIALCFFALGILMGIGIIVVGFAYGVRVVTFPFGGVCVCFFLYLLYGLSRYYVAIDNDWIEYFDGKRLRRERLSKITGYYGQGIVLVIKLGNLTKPLQIPVVLFSKAHVFLEVLKERTNCISA